MIERQKLNPIEKLAYWLLALTDIDNTTLRKSVAEAARALQPGTKVLDAGAGLKPYAGLFSHCDYSSCDFANCDEFFGNLDDGRRDDLAARHTYVAPLDHIPVADDTFDFILCTQVLEHVPYPTKVAEELCRVLNPSGTLFLTVPQGYGIHGEPYNFYYFTKYGLELTLRDAGFESIVIKERGGYFHYLYDRLAYAIPRIVVGYRHRMFWMMLLLSPLHVFLAYVLGPLLLALEPLDREKRFTLGYIAIARKTTTVNDLPIFPRGDHVKTPPL